MERTPSSSANLSSGIGPASSNTSIFLLGQLGNIWGFEKSEIEQLFCHDCTVSLNMR